MRNRFGTREAIKGASAFIIAVAATISGCGGGGGGGGGAAQSARYAYVPNMGDNTVSVYAVDASSGNLRATGYVSAGTQPDSIALTPNGKFAFVANYGGSDISAYSVDASTGVLTATACVASGAAGAVVTCSAAGNFAIGSGSAVPMSVITDPTGTYAYVVDSAGASIYAYRIDQTSGILYTLSSYPTGAGTGPRQAVMDSSGKHLYVANGNGSVGAWSIAADGSLTQLAGSPNSTGSQIFNVAVNPTGTFLFAPDRASGNVAVLPITTSGALGSPVGSSYASGLTQPDGASVEPSGKYLLVTDWTNGGVVTMAIGATGALTFAGSNPGTGVNPNAASIDPTGKFVYVPDMGSNTISAYSLSASGALAYLNGKPANSNYAARSQPMPQIAFTKGAPLVATPKFAYVANSVDKSVSAYSINAASGALTSAGSATALAGTTAPAKIVTHPGGKFAYVVESGQIEGYAIDTTTGLLSTAVSGSPYACQYTSPYICMSAAVDPTGRFLYVLAGGILSGSACTSYVLGICQGTYPTWEFDLYITKYSIDPASGVLTAPTNTVVSAPGGGGYVSVTTLSDLAFGTTGGSLYVSDPAYGQVHALTVNAAGAVAVTGTYGTYSGTPQPGALAVDPAGQYLFVANHGSNDISAFVISLTGGGALTQVTCSPAGTLPCSASGNFTTATMSAPSGITVDQQGNVYVTSGSGNNVSAISGNPNTAGALGFELAGSPFPAGQSPAAIALDLSGKFVYAANSLNGTGGNSISAWTVGGIPPANWLSVVTGSPFSTGAGPVSIATTGTIQ